MTAKSKPYTVVLDVCEPEQARKDWPNLRFLVLCETSGSGWPEVEVAALTRWELVQFMEKEGYEDFFCEVFK